MSGIQTAFFVVNAGGGPGPPAPTVHTYSSPGTFTETIPGGYSSLTIEAWGGSGGGGNAYVPTQQGGGGGAGASYSRSTFALTSGNTGQTINLQINGVEASTLVGVAGSVFSMSEMFVFGSNRGGNASAGSQGAGGTPVTPSGGNAANIAGNPGTAGDLFSTAGGAGGAAIVGLNGTGPAGGHGQFTLVTGQVGLVLFAYTP